MKEAFDKMKKK